MEIDRNKIYKMRDYSFINYINLDKETIEKIRIARNHPDIRKVMYNKNEISKEEHIGFINNLEKSHDKAYWYILKGDRPIGVVNLVDIDSQKECAEWGFYILPDQKNSGKFIELLTAVFQFMFEILGFKSLYGFTNVRNIEVLILNEYFGATFGEKKSLNGEDFIQHETIGEDFLKNKDAIGNLRNFLLFLHRKK